MMVFFHIEYILHLHFYYYCPLYNDTYVPLQKCCVYIFAHYREILLSQYKEFGRVKLEPQNVLQPPTPNKSSVYGYKQMSVYIDYLLITLSYYNHYYGVCSQPRLG